MGISQVDFITCEEYEEDVEKEEVFDLEREDLI
jgi:hypothetical protein